MSYITYKANKINKLLQILYFLLSVYLIYTGTQFIVASESPKALATLSTLWSGFINSFPSHLTLISGALGFTHALWLLSKGKN